MLKSTIKMLFWFFIVLIPFMVMAQVDNKDAKTDASTDKVVVKDEVKTEVKAEVPAIALAPQEETIDIISMMFNKGKDAFDAARGGAWLLFSTIIIQLLTTLLKLLDKIKFKLWAQAPEHWRTIIVLGLGVGMSFLQTKLTGSSWMECSMVAMSGILAIISHENIIRPFKEKKSA